MDALSSFVCSEEAGAFFWCCFRDSERLQCLALVNSSFHRAACRSIRRVNAARFFDKHQLPALVRNAPLLQTFKVFSSDIDDYTVFASFPELRELVIRGVEMDVAALAYLSACPKLEILKIDEPPDDISVIERFPSLRELELWPCEDITSLPGCASLTRLYARGAAIDDVANLAACSNLAHLNVGFAETLVDISALSSCTKLKTLVLSHTLVEDIACLSKCSLLRSIELEDTQISDISALSSCTNLQQLNISKTRVESIDALTSCTSLIKLDALGTRLRSIAALEWTPNLRWVGISATRISSLAPLAHCTAIEKLVCSAIPLVTSVAPLASLSRLKSLEIQHTRITDIAPLASCLQLTSLDIAYSDVTDVSPLANLELFDALMVGSLEDIEVGSLAELKKARPGLKIDAILDAYHGM